VRWSMRLATINYPERLSAYLGYRYISAYVGYHGPNSLTRRWRTAA
jgi:hypothetical protein